MHTLYIPDAETFEKIVSTAVKKTMIDTLPELLEKATRPKWLTTDEVMQILKCSRRHAQFLRDSNRLPFHKHGRSIRYKVDDIENYMNAGKVEAEGFEK